MPPNSRASKISKTVINAALFQPNSLTKVATVAMHGMYSIAHAQLLEAHQKLCPKERTALLLHKLKFESAKHPITKKRQL